MNAVKKIAKVTNIKKTTNTPFYNKIRDFFSENIDVNYAKNVTEFLNSLYDTDYISLFDHNFTLTYKNLKKSRNMSYFDWDFETDEQRIVIANDWKKSSSNQFKKYTIIDSYFHELTHKKQADLALIGEDIKLNVFDKLLCLEITENLNIPYELKLCELDARIQSTKRQIDLFKKGILPINCESLYCAIANIDDIIFAFNRFNVSNGEIEFDIEKFTKRYFASIKLELIKTKEDERTYSFLDKESFILKFKILLNKKLEKFKQDIEYIYENALNTYKMSDKIAKKLNLKKDLQKAFYLNAKEYKHNDSVLNIINQDLSDRFYLRKHIDDIHLNNRKYFKTQLEKYRETGD